MDFSQKEYYVNRIIAGLIKIHPGFFIGAASALERFLAEEIYKEAYAASYEAGAFLEEELSDFLLSRKIWTAENEEQLASLNSDLEKIKTGVLTQQLQYKELKKTKKAVAKLKEEIAALLNKKHSLDFLSCRGFANIEKSKYLLCTSLQTIDGSPIFESYWEADSELLNQLMHKYLDEKLSERQLRLLAREEPWRSFWAIGKESNLFGSAVADYTDEQRGIVLWSSFYDNIYGHPEKPGDVIIEDDDFLDGWLIEQRRKSKVEETKKKTGVDDKKGDVFIPVDSQEAAREINEMNDTVASMYKRQRMNKVKKEGKVNELEMPDTKKRLQMAYNNMMRNRQ